MEYRVSFYMKNWGIVAEFVTADTPDEALASVLGPLEQKGWRMLGEPTVITRAEYDARPKQYGHDLADE